MDLSRISYVMSLAYRYFDTDSSYTIRNDQASWSEITFSTGLFHDIVRLLWLTK